MDALKRKKEDEEKKVLSHICIIKISTRESIFLSQEWLLIILGSFLIMHINMKSYSIIKVIK